MNIADILVFVLVVAAQIAAYVWLAKRFAIPFWRRFLAQDAVTDHTGADTAATIAR